MKMRCISVLVLCCTCGAKIGSALKPASDPSIREDSVDLEQKMAEMEKRLSALEIGGQDEILKRVSEVETRCAHFSAVVFGRMKNAEKAFITVDAHLLEEVQRAHRKLSEAFEKIRNLELEVASDLQQTRTDISQENRMEERCTICGDVTKMNKTLRNHSSQFTALNTQLLDKLNTCADPPEIYNGYPLVSNRENEEIKHGDVVTYACHDNSTLVGSGEIVCHSGEWTGNLPECMNSCKTEDLKGFGGLDVSEDRIIEHSKSLDVRCLRGYANSTSESLTCFNGTWQISDNPCIEDTCGDPPEIDFGYPIISERQNKGTKHGEVVTYACHDNSTLVGSGEMVCNLGQWTGDLPECTNKSCKGEPPTVRNGNTMDFERKPGSNVRYECDRNYVMTTNSTIHCKGENWEGQPPVCNFFDSTFYLETSPVPSSVLCYSFENYGKIGFSRVLDTGSGGNSSSRISQGTGSGFAFFRLGRPRDFEEYGAFECGINDEGGGSMNIVVQIQYVDGGLYFSDPFKVVNIGDTVVLKVNFDKEFPIIWRHNGVDVPSWNNKERVEIPSVQVTDAGTYECYYEGRRGAVPPALLRMIVRKCKKNLFGENCDQQCPPCYNGGICHDHLGVCVCPPGFIGKNCEEACGHTRYGTNCSRRCTSDYCGGKLFCQPNPYGCSCARGFKGIKCSERCEDGWYGADCKQPCHCANGPQNCDIYTGTCSGGCSSDWTGQSCQIQVLD